MDGVSAKDLGLICFSFFTPLPAQNGTHCQKRLKEVCRLVLQTHQEWELWNREQRQPKKVLSDPQKIRDKKKTRHTRVTERCF